MNKKDNMFKGTGDTEEVELEVENTEELDKLLDETKTEIFEIHNRFENGKYTEDDLLNHLPHYGLEFENGMKMLLVETKYFDDLANRYINLKEIEKSHKEENGKLRVELEQEKEKNKELEAKRIWNKGRIEELKNELVQEKEKNNALEKYQKLYLDGELITAKQGKFFEKMIKENYIKKDKIKEIYNILGEYRHFSTPTNEQIEQNENAVDKAVNFIKELLEEK